MAPHLSPDPPTIEVQSFCHENKSQKMTFLMGLVAIHPWSGVVSFTSGLASPPLGNQSQAGATK